MTATFQYRAPATRAELLGLVADNSERTRVLAGGTDLLVDLRMGLRHPELVVDVKRVEGFGDITWSQREGLVIRPAVTINDVLADATVRERFPLLVACAHDLASHQIRNRATVAGNVVNASPCADMAPALLCMGARAVISSSTGSREVPFKEFFTGVKQTVVRPGEVLEEIVVPARSADGCGAYRKLKRIKGHDLGVVGVAAFRKDGALTLGISSSAPTPILVEGLSVSDPVEAVVEAARRAINPITDVRCSREYREHMVEVYTRRVLQEVAA